MLPGHGVNFRAFNRSQDYAALSDALIEMGYEYRDGRLCVFVGAGISVACGLPNWIELNERLFDASFADLFPTGGFDGTVEKPTSLGGALKKFSIN